MTVQELIEELQKVEDKDAPIVVRDYRPFDWGDCTDIRVERSKTSATDYDARFKKRSDQVECIRLMLINPATAKQTVF